MKEKEKERKKLNLVDNIKDHRREIRFDLMTGDERKLTKDINKVQDVDSFRGERSENRFFGGRRRGSGSGIGRVDETTEILSNVLQEMSSVGRMELFQNGDDADNEGGKVEGFFLVGGAHHVESHVESEFGHLGNDKDKSKQSDVFDGIGSDIDFGEGVGDASSFQKGGQIGKQRIVVAG